MFSFVRYTKSIFLSAYFLHPIWALFYCVTFCSDEHILFRHIQAFSYLCKKDYSSEQFFPSHKSISLLRKKKIGSGWQSPTIYHEFPTINYRKDPLTRVFSKFIYHYSYLLIRTFIVSFTPSVFAPCPANLTYILTLLVDPQL